MISRALTRLLTLTAAAATAVALSAGTASAATPVAVAPATFVINAPAAPVVDAPSSTTFVAPTAQVDLCNGVLCIRLSREETAKVANAPIGEVASIVGPFCGLLPGPLAVLCGAGIAIGAADLKLTSQHAVQSGRCLVMVRGGTPVDGLTFQGDCKA